METISCGGKVNTLKFEIQKELNKEEDLLKELKSAKYQFIFENTKAFTEGKISALKGILKIIKKTLTNSKKYGII